MSPRRNILLLLVLLAATGSLWAQQAIGEWQDHNSFVAAYRVCTTPNRVYAATRMALYYYDRQADTTLPLTKTEGLSDVGISTMAYDPQTGYLTVAYANSGIDLIAPDGTVHHIADIRYSSISGDKQIYAIAHHGGKAYLATGFGIVVVDLTRHEIVETDYIGEEGEACAVYGVTFTDSLIVAATDRGMLQAPADSPRLHIYETWVLDTLSPLAGKAVHLLESNAGQLIAGTLLGDGRTKLYAKRYDGWWQWMADELLSVKCHDGLIVISHPNYITIFDSSYYHLRLLDNLPHYGVTIWDADVDTNRTLWIGHQWAGLLEADTAVCSIFSLDQPPRQHSPAGPFNNDYVYSLTTTSSSLYLCPGGKKPTYESAYLPGGLSVLTNGQWSQISRAEGLPDFQDVLQVAVDPKDRKHLSATAWGYGVLDIHNQVADTLFNASNTNGVLTPYRNGDFEHLRVSGLAYDDAGNLWVTNSLVPGGLAVRYRNGSWRSFNISSMLQGLSQEKREIDRVVWDSIRGYKWITGRANRIYVLDGEGQMAYVNPNNGSRLETHTVTCLVQDRSGDLWFGTDKGLKVIYDGYRAFANGGNGEQSPVNCSNILYNADGINEYLMAYESITCLAVDGANRKWVGTANNGLYLISASGQEQLHHFTTANSPLSSDKIVALAVHPETGIVYIGTDKGLQSYRSTATVAYSEPSSHIHAFPNPVRPKYDGVVAIKGFTRDALVHITDVRGHVVYSTTAHGGQAIWNQCTLDGTRVASGTYFVFASDSEGNNRSVAKILIIR